MSMLGRYYYKGCKNLEIYIYRPPKIRGEDSSKKHRFQIQSVTQDIAELHFLDTKLNRVPIPNGFRMIDTSGEEIIPHFGGFFITWIESYQLQHHDNTIFEMINERQSIMSTNGSVICKRFDH